MKRRRAASSVLCLTVFCLLSSVLCQSGCASPPATPRRDATALLLARPDFKTAAQSAPGWVGAALQQITEYERQLDTRP